MSCLGPTWQLEQGVKSAFHMYGTWNTAIPDSRRYFSSHANIRFVYVSVEQAFLAFFRVIINDKVSLMVAQVGSASHVAWFCNYPGRVVLWEVRLETGSHGERMRSQKFELTAQFHLHESRPSSAASESQQVSIPPTQMGLAGPNRRRCCYETLRTVTWRSGRAWVRRIESAGATVP